MEDRICGYRNCNNIMTNRKQAIYCCRGCKDMERTYVVRRKKWIEKYSNIQRVLVNIIKEEKIK